MKGNYHYDKFMAVLQDMNEISGPDTPTEFIKILEAVKDAIEIQIVEAKMIKETYGDDGEMP
jgi:hypothetical protein